MQQPTELPRWRRLARQAAQAGGRRLSAATGSPERARVVIILGSVLALSSADAATVGAAATQLRAALHIGNTDIGLLVAVSSLVAAAASIPFGILADRVRRTWTLGIAVGTWGVAMLWSATASSFDRLLLARVFLGVVTAAAGPVVASLIGDYFDASERGRIYSYILTGELAGAGLGFAVTGDIAALSWRASFVILAIPAFVLAWHVLRLPEPVRGGHQPLALSGDSRSIEANGDTAQATPVSGDTTGQTPSGPTDAQRIAAARGVEPDFDRVLGPEASSMGLADAVRAVLGIRTNVILIVASACGYFYMSGVETFGAEFAKQQYGIDQALANFLLLIVGIGAMLGVVFSGGLSDRLLQRGFLNSRIVIPGVAAILASVLFLPAIFTRSATTALPYLVLAAFMLSAQNPPIDAARLDIVPPYLWGRAEGIRTTLRTLAQSMAPAVFGFMSEHILSGGRAGLQWTFALMVVVLTASGVILLRARSSYPRDVATAAASYGLEAPESEGGTEPGSAGSGGSGFPGEPAPPSPGAGTGTGSGPASAPAAGPSPTPGAASTAGTVHPAWPSPAPSPGAWDNPWPRAPGGSAGR